MGKVYMKNQYIGSYRQLHQYFSPREMLQDKQNFAILVNRLFGNMEKEQPAAKVTVGNPLQPAKREGIKLVRYERSALCSLFTLAVLRSKGKLGRMAPRSLCGYDMLPDYEGKKEKIFLGYIQDFEKEEIEDIPKCMGFWTDHFMADGASMGMMYVIKPNRRKLAMDMYGIVQKTGLSRKQQTELFYMLMTGYLLSGHTLESVPLQPEDARKGFLEEWPVTLLEQELTGVISPRPAPPRPAAPDPRPVGGGVSEKNTPDRESPETSEKKPQEVFEPENESNGNYFSEEPVLELCVRKTPHRFNLHPACSSQGKTVSGFKKEIRQLPEGCVIRSHVIKAGPSPTGTKGVPLTLQFFKDEKSKTPSYEYILKEGEYLHLNAVHDKTGGMALPPLPDEVVTGRGFSMKRDVKTTNVLKLNNQSLTSLAQSGDVISSFAPSPRGGGCLFIRNGIFCDWKFDVDSLRGFIDFLEGDGMPTLVEMSLRDTTLYVLTDKGTVLRGDGSENVRMKNLGRVLTLKDL